MTTAEFNRLSAFRLAKLNEYTGNTYTMYDKHRLSQVVNAQGGLRTITGRASSNADMIEMLDAMLYGIETGLGLCNQKPA